MRPTHPASVPAAALALAFMACDTQSEGDRTAEFAPYLVPCPGFGEPCLEDSRANEPLMLHDVHGLAFEWGFRQRVRLKPHAHDPKVDTTSWDWDVDTLFAKLREADWSFRARLPADSTAWKLTGDTLAILGYPAIAVADPDLARIFQNRGKFPVSLRIRPSDTVLFGDSTRVEYPALPD